MGLSRQECRSGLPFPSPVDLPDPEIESRSPALRADALPSEPSEANYHDALKPKSRNVMLHYSKKKKLSLQFI